MRAPPRLQRRLYYRLRQIGMRTLSVRARLGMRRTDERKAVWCAGAFVAVAIVIAVWVTVRG